MECDQRRGTSSSCTRGFVKIFLLTFCQVLGIRELLDRDSPDSEADFAAPGTDSAPQTRAQSFDILIHGDSSCYVEPSLLAPPSKAVVFALLDIYMHRIDPILKLIHGPSLRTLLLESSACEPAIEALKSAIFFTALCTLEEQECVDIVGEAKSKTVNRLRIATELSLSRANLLTARNFTVLQAFVICLVSTPTQSSAIFDYIGWSPSEPRSTISLGIDPRSGASWASSRTRHKFVSNIAVRVRDETSRMVFRHDSRCTGRF